VAELRDALEARGLDTKGTKPFLVERLMEALAAEAVNGGGEAAEAVGQETYEAEDMEESQVDVYGIRIEQCAVEPVLRIYSGYARIRNFLQIRIWISNDLPGRIQIQNYDKGSGLLERKMH